MRAAGVAEGLLVRVDLPGRPSFEARVVHEIASQPLVYGHGVEMVTVRPEAGDRWLRGVYVERCTPIGGAS